MASRFQYDENSEDEFDVEKLPRGDGIGQSMKERLEMQQIKQMPHEELAKVISTNAESVTLPARTRARPSNSTASVKTRSSMESSRSNLNSPVGLRKSDTKQHGMLVRTPSIISDSDEDSDDETWVERKRAKERERLERAQKQRELDSRLSTPKRRSTGRDHLSQQSLSSRGLLPGPPMAYRQVRGHPHLRQRIPSRQKRLQGYYSMEGHDMRMHQVVSGTATQQNSGVLQKAMDWITGDDVQSKRLESAIQSIGFYQRQIASLQAENDALKADLIELRGRNDQFTTELREAQVKSFKEMAKDFWAPLEDRVIEEKLAEIHKELEDWVDDNCIDSFEDLKPLSEPDQQVLLEFLRKITIVGESTNLSCQIDIWEKQEMDIILLITSIITHQMYIALFSNPFLILDSVVGSSSPEQFSSTMKATYEALLSVNERGAHRWRAEMMRILLPKPPAGGRFDGIQPANEQILLFIRNFCEMLVVQLENSPIKAFFRDDRPEESQAQLVDCWVRAAEVYTQLQTQLSSVYWPNPIEVDMIGHLFDPRYVEAHRSQAFPEGSNFGKPVSLVISPFVALRGNEDGERYGRERERVISKAIVRVIERDDYM